MAVVFYEHTSFTPAGFVADFCPICGALRRFAVEEEESEHRLYMLTVNEPTLMSTRARCTGCGQVRRIKPDDYACFVGDLIDDVDALARKTNPKLLAMGNDGMKLWEKMHRDPESLSAGEQQEIVDQVVAAVRNTLELRHAITGRTNVRIDPPVAIAVIAPFLLTGLCFFLFDKTVAGMGDAGQISSMAIGLLVMPVACGLAMWARQKKRLKMQLVEMFRTGTRALQLTPRELLARVPNSSVSSKSVAQIAQKALETAATEMAVT